MSELVNPVNQPDDLHLSISNRLREAYDTVYSSEEEKEAAISVDHTKEE